MAAQLAAAIWIGAAGQALVQRRRLQFDRVAHKRTREKVVALRVTGEAAHGATAMTTVMMACRTFDFSCASGMSQNHGESNGCQANAFQNASAPK